MGPYVLKRLLLLVPTLFGVTIVIFIAVRLAPGDVALVVATSGAGGSISPEEIQHIRELLGLDRPIIEQYVSWIGGALRGDLGEAYWFPSSVGSLIWRRLLITFEVGLLSVGLALLLAVPAGIISAAKQNTAIDHVLRLVSLGGLSVPTFWTGMVIVLITVRYFNWLPPPGHTSPFDDPSLNLQQVIFPTLVIGFALWGPLLRLTRAAAIEVLREDYIRTAHSKGLNPISVLRHHLLPNILLPVVTLAGVYFAAMAAGLVVTERVFSIQGIGNLFVEAVSVRDYPVIQGIVLIVGVVAGLTNLVVDLLYGWLDPRIRRV